MKSIVDILIESESFSTFMPTAQQVRDEIEEAVSVISGLNEPVVVFDEDPGVIEVSKTVDIVSSEDTVYSDNPDLGCVTYGYKMKIELMEKSTPSVKATAFFYDDDSHLDPEQYGLGNVKNRKRASYKKEALSEANRDWPVLWAEIRRLAYDLKPYDPFDL